MATAEASGKSKRLRWSILFVAALLSLGVLVAVKKASSSLPHLRTSDIQEAKLLRFGMEGKVIPVWHYRHGNDQSEISEVVRMLNDCRVPLSEPLGETTPETVIEITTRDGGDIRIWDPFAEFVTVGVKLPSETYRQVKVTSLKPPVFLQTAFNESERSDGEAQGMR